MKLNKVKILKVYLKKVYFWKFINFKCLIDVTIQYQTKWPYQQNINQAIT